MNPTLLRSDMRYWRLQPDVRLRSVVQCYFVALPPNDTVAHSTQEELLLPDSQSELVFIMSGGFDRWPLGESTRAAPMRASYAIGGRSNSIITTATPDLAVAGVKLSGTALRQLVDMPLSAFREAALPLKQAPRRALLQLEDELANASSIAAMQRAFDRFFLCELKNLLAAQDDSVRSFIAHAERSRGASPVNSWLARERIDARTFERRFCAWTGLTPKRHARIVRFKHSYHAWLRSHAAPAAHGHAAPAAHGHNAHLDGYFDESHFAREFRAFLGTSPTRRETHSAVRPLTGISEHLLEREMSGL